MASRPLYCLDRLPDLSGHDSHPDLEDRLNVGSPAKVRERAPYTRGARSFELFKPVRSGVSTYSRLPR